VDRILAFAVRAVLALTFSILAAGSSLAATYYVDNQHASANDTNPGTESAPYRTITAAVTQRGGAGNTIVVKTGTYREQVTVSASGASGSPLVIQAQGAATLEGSEDYAVAARWTPVSGTTWLASGVTWEPNQVFVGGRRLVKTTMTTLPLNSFRWVLGSGLYVNVAGGNPGLQGARVGRHDYGFRIIGRSFVTVRGFTIVRADVKAVFADASTGIVVENVRAQSSASAGIHFSAAQGGRIEGCEAVSNGDHGIFLSMNATGVVVRGNRSQRNARVDRDGANGFHLFSAPANRLEDNEAWDNQDSGFQFNSGSNGNVSVLNRSWSNDDHGFDHLGSSGVVHVHDVAADNAHDGFSFEGNSPGGQVHNSIGVNNGTGLFHYDLWVDATSQAGFDSDYNVFWNANGQAPVRWGPTPYLQVSGWSAATGNDAHSRQADPRFVNPAAGDFHLLAGSPAIDAASSAVAHWPSLDADGRARFDVAGVANTGAGPVTYADRGAFEFGGAVSTNPPPVAALTVTPSSGAAPLAVVANASASTDDGAIVSYRFDFGDGTIKGPQPGATASHTYATSGTRVVTVQVTDDEGATATAMASVVVGSGGSGDRAPVVTAPARVSVDEASRLTIRVEAKDPDGNAIGSLTADLSKLPSGHNARFTSVGDTAGTLIWTPTYDDSGTYAVTFRASNALTGTATTTIHVRNVDRAPIVSAPPEIKASPGTPVVFQVTARDPDGDAIQSLRADLDGAPGATFVELSLDHTRGVFTWVPGTNALKNGKVGNFHLRFIARNALTGGAETHIQVKLRRAAEAEPVAETEALPATLELSAPRPNPSREVTTFALDLPADADVAFAIYDVQGREVWRESGRMSAGRRTLSWNGTNAGGGGRAGAGVFYARVVVGDRTFTRRVVRH
jgi:hypothetical protein